MIPSLIGVCRRVKTKAICRPHEGLMLKKYCGKQTSQRVNTKTLAGQEEDGGGE